MKLDLRKLVLGAAIALTPQLMNAQDVTVEAVAASNAADIGEGEVATFYDNGVNGNIRMKSSTVPQGDLDTWLARPTHLLGGLRQYIPGETDAEKMADYDGVIVFPFQIPEIPVGKQLKSVSFSSYLETGTSWGVLNVDLYVLDSRADGNVLGTDFFVGESPAAPATDFLVQAPYITKGHGVPEDIAARTIATNGASNGYLTSYFQAEYDAGNALKYTYVRLNHRTIEAATYLRLSISSADNPSAAQHPKLTFVFEDDNSLSISNKDVSSLSIYPNPVVGGEFSIQLPEAGNNFDLQILDLAGKSVYSSSFVKSGNVVNVSADFNAGVYIVKLSSEVSVSTQKLMVK